MKAYIGLIVLFGTLLVSATVVPEATDECSKRCIAEKTSLCTEYYKGNSVEIQRCKDEGIPTCIRNSCPKKTSTGNLSVSATDAPVATDECSKRCIAEKTSLCTEYYKGHGAEKIQSCKDKGIPACIKNSCPKKTSTGTLSVSATVAPVATDECSKRCIAEKTSLCTDYYKGHSVNIQKCKDDGIPKCIRNSCSKKTYNKPPQ